MQSSHYQAYWKSQQTPNHSHITEDWFDKYAEEVRQYLPKEGIAVDAGCGSGDLLLRLGSNFKKVIAIDYSESMLSSAKEKCSSLPTEIIFHCDNVTNIKKYCNEEVDCIYCYSVVQYLSKEELKNFFYGCFEVLKKTGSLNVFLVPNINCKTLFRLGFYRHQEYVPFYKIIRGLIALSFKKIVYPLKNSFKPYDDGIGNWFSVNEISEAAKGAGFSLEIVACKFINYGYRFHAILKK